MNLYPLQVLLVHINLIYSGRLSFRGSFSFLGLVLASMVHSKIYCQPSIGSKRNKSKRLGKLTQKMFVLEPTIG